jgi:hypothetical protein
MSVIRRSIAIWVVLSSCLLAGVVPLRADYRHRDCRRNVRIAEHRLERAIERYGEHSPKAERRRAELDRIREECRERMHERHEHEEHEEHMEGRH